MIYVNNCAEGSTKRSNFICMLLSNNKEFKMTNKQYIQVPKNLAISESGFLFSPSSGESFTMNEFGVWIFKLLQSGKSKDEIVDAIISEYDIDQKHAEFDLEDFLIQLDKFSLINI